MNLFTELKENGINAFQNWKEAKEEAKIVSLLELTINLTGYRYSFNGNTIPDNFLQLVVNLDASTVYSGNQYLFALPAKDKEKILTFYSKICTIAAEPWLSQVVKLTDALIDAPGNEMEDCHTTAAVIRIVLLKGLSKYLDAKPELKEICVRLFGNMKKAFMYKEISKDCVEQFCSIMETYAKFYVSDDNMLDNYFTILTYECLAESKLAIKSLKKLMKSEVLVQDTVATYIHDQLLPCLTNLIHCPKVSLAQEAIELLILLQEYFGTSNALNSIDTVNISQYMISTNTKIRNLAAKLMFNVSETPLVDFLDAMCSFEISANDILKLVQVVWKPEIFSDWDVYFEMLQKKQKFMPSIVVLVIEASLDQLKTKYEPSNEIIDGLDLTYANLFITTFPRWLNYFRDEHRNPKVLQHLLQLLPKIYCKLYANINDQKIAQVTVYELLVIIKETVEYRKIFQILWFSQTIKQTIGDSITEFFETHVNKLIEVSIDILKNVHEENFTPEVEISMKIMSFVSIIQDMKRILDIEREIKNWLQDEMLQKIDCKAAVFVLGLLLYMMKVCSAREESNDVEADSMMGILEKVMKTSLAYIQEQSKVDFHVQTVFQTLRNTVAGLNNAMSIRFLNEMSKTVMSFVLNKNDFILLGIWMDWIKNSGVDPVHSAEMVQHFGNDHPEKIASHLNTLLATIYENGTNTFYNTIAITIILINANNGQICSMKNFIKKLVAFMEKNISKETSDDESNRLENIFVKIVQHNLPNNGLTESFMKGISPLVAAIHSNHFSLTKLNTLLSDMLEKIDDTNEQKKESLRLLINNFRDSP